MKSFLILSNSFVLLHEEDTTGLPMDVTCAQLFFSLAKLDFPRCTQTLALTAMGPNISARMKILKNTTTTRQVKRKEMNLDGAEGV